MVEGVEWVVFMKRALLTIGKLAKESQLNISTIRYYEKRGLMVQPFRAESGYRFYPPEAVVRLRFVREAQELGFTLGEIGDLLSRHSKGKVPRRALKFWIKSKLDHLEHLVRVNVNRRNLLRQLLAACDSPRAAKECPMLKLLERWKSQK